MKSFRGGISSAHTPAGVNILDEKEKMRIYSSLIDAIRQTRLLSGHEAQIKYAKARNRLGYPTLMTTYNNNVFVMQILWYDEWSSFALHVRWQGQETQVVVPATEESIKEVAELITGLKARLMEAEKAVIAATAQSFRDLAFTPASV